MANDVVLLASDFYREIRRDFAATYKATYEGLGQRLGQVMKLSSPSSKLTEYYGYFESAPRPVRWDYGDPFPFFTFSSKAFSTTNYRFAAGMRWKEDDREDDQLGGLLDQAKEAGRNFAFLPEMAFYEMRSGSASLLKAIPNAPDGVAMFYATDGAGAARYGVTGGNIISGTGVTSPQLIIDDLMSAIVRMMQFQDTRGNPLFNTDVIKNGFVITYNVANEEVFGKALYQLTQFHSIASATSPYDPAAAGVSNFIKDYGLKIEAWPTQLITDNDWDVYLKNPPSPILIEQTRRGLRERFTMGADNNSDIVRNTGDEAGQWDARLGYGVGPCYSAVRVNN